MSAPAIEFLFDFVSPYAYLAWTQVHALAARHGRDVEPIPVLFAALLDAYGHKGPAEIPPKKRYIFADVVRTARVLGVPLAPPPSHPFNPLVALRVASLPAPPAVRRARIDALYAAAWARGEGVEGTEACARALDAAGLDGAALVREATSDEAKARLRAQTDAALAAGVFGVPTVRVDGEPFWGLDAFGHLERFLRGEDPITPELRARIAALAPSATRPAAAITDSAPDARARRA